VPIHFQMAVLAIVAWLCAVAPLQAQVQGRDRRHASAVFGADDPRQAGQPQDGVLSAAGSVFGAFDDSLFAVPGLETALQPQSRSRGSYAGFLGGLAYNRPDEALQASFSSAGHYFPATDRLALGRQAADLSAAMVISPWRTANLRSSASARYARDGLPFEGAGFSAGGFPLDLFYGDDAVHVPHSYSVRGNVGLEQEWGRRRSVSLVASVQTAAVQGTARSRGFELGGTLTNQVGRYGSLRAGYRRQEIGHGGANYVVHNLDTGADYGRPLSNSRRAFVTFGGGSALIESRGHVSMHAIGDAGLRYELGRTWNGSARYHRGFIFVDEVADPLLTDGLIADLSGLLSRRLELFGSGSLMRGTTGLADTETPYYIYLARTQIRYALSRIAGVYGEYLFFNYRFAESVGLGARLPSSLDRRTFRVGVTVMTQLRH